MKFGFIYILIFITFNSCSDQGPGSQDSPEAARMVQKWAGCDTLEYEPGIDPIPSSSDTLLQIMWYSHPEGNSLKEFRIYRSTEPDGSRRYNSVGVVKVVHSNAQDTIFVDSDLKLYQRFSYYVTAVNDEGIESVPSDTVWYELIDKAILHYPKDLSEPIALPAIFRWDYVGSSGINPGRYIVRIEQYWDETFHPLVFVKIVDAEYGQPNQLIIDSLKTEVSWNRFRWRVDCIGSNELTEGSESDWHLFDIE